MQQQQHFCRDRDARTTRLINTTNTNEQLPHPLSLYSFLIMKTTQQQREESGGGGSPKKSSSSSSSSSCSEEDEETSSEDAVSVHASMLSSEIAQRVHPNVDFFEGHLQQVKERAELTIAKLEELKLFLLLLLKKKTPTTTSLCNNEEEEEEDLEDEAKKTFKMEKEIRELSERMEKDFAFVDSAAETLKTIDAKVTEMEKEIWEQEKEMVKNTVGTKVEELRENFGKMLSGFAGFARSSSHAQSVDFEDAEKLRKEAMSTVEETKQETTTKATAEKVPPAAHKEDNNGYYFGEDDSGDIQHSPEKEKTTTGLFGGFFSSSS